MGRESKRLAVFHPEFRDDLRYWVKTERNTALRVLELAEAVLRNPLAGVGKPEALRHVLAGMLVQTNHAGAPLGLSRQRRPD